MDVPIEFGKSRPRVWILTAVLAILIAPPMRAADEAPVLMSRTGGQTVKWKNLEEIQKAAAAGEADAMLELGTMHEFGREVPEDPLRARTLYLQASAAGLPEADFRLGRLLSEGLGGPADLPAAFERYLRAARAGLPLAQYNVGAMLASARGVKRDYVEGLAWVILATRDASVDPEGEKRLRARMTRRPQEIAAAEARAVALADELKAAKEKPAGSARDQKGPGAKVDLPVAAPVSPLPGPPGVRPPLPPPISLPPLPSPGS